MPRSRLNITRLEDRCTPATWNNPWPDARHLTLSFAPDGTASGSAASTLFAAMPSGDWQLAALRAIQTWAINANINVSMVADGGQPFGGDGAPQGDARFGDIRLGAVPLMDSSELGQASPFDALAGTWAGDVLFDRSRTFSLNGQNGFDLYSVLLHEFGHVFGLAHSPNPSSVMSEGYQGIRFGISAEDIFRLQALYGARSPDANEGATGNGTFTTATQCSMLSAGGLLGFRVAGDITTQGDRDLFRFNTSLNVGGALLRLKTSDLSLLSARMTVYNSLGQSVATKMATDPRSGDLEIRIANVQPFSTYYAAIDGATSDVFGIGSYLLAVSELPPVNGILGGLAGAADQAAAGLFEVLANNDLHTNDSFATATLLPPLASQTNSRFDAGYSGSISDGWDRDLYRIVAPQGGNVMTVMAWGAPTRGLLTGNQHLDPQLTVYDSLGDVIASRILVNDGYTFAIQVTNAQPGAAYFVGVTSGDGGTSIGNYFVGVEFGNIATNLLTLSQGELAAGTSSAADTLEIQRGGLFHFVLTADAAVAMTVYDSNGQIVFVLQSSGGDAVSRNFYFGPGRYSVKFTAGNQAVHFKLRGSRLSDPIGPQPVDPTENPSGGSNSPQSQPNDEWRYEWAGGGAENPSKLPPQDPSGDPHTGVA